MSDDQNMLQRRRFLSMVGGGAVVLPFAGIVACSSEEENAPTIAASAEDTAAKRPDPAEPDADAMQSTAAETTDEVSADTDRMAQNDTGGSTGSGSLPKLSEDNAQAKSLQYKHIASDVDHSRYKEGQKCSNCQLWQGSDTDEWAGCGIFAGKAVKASGWCTAYAAASA